MSKIDVGESYELCFDFSVQEKQPNRQCQRDSLVLSCSIVS